MELIVEGELGDIAGPGGDPAGLLLQQLLRASALTHQCVQLKIRMPRQRDLERHLSTSTGGRNPPLMETIRARLQPPCQPREAVWRDGARPQGHCHRQAGLREPPHLLAQDSQTSLGGGYDLQEIPSHLWVGPGANDPLRVTLKVDDLLR